jgi:serum/glucocorticoid-regulated kinase 2
VRVRTDDLESVRVERAIKRVRSDLAAHVGGIPTAKEKENVMSAASSAAPSEAGSIYEKEEYDQDHDYTQLASHQEVHGEEEEAGEGDPSEKAKIAGEEPNDATATGAPAADGDEVEAAPTGEENEAELRAAGETAPQTPDVLMANNRVHRSQSLDPDKSHRLSRAYTTSVPSQSGAESQTGDESSSSAALDGGAKRRRKKRTSSGRGTPKDREPRKSQRKVVIDDFEMMRVLGKGCAGKVLLVRHKVTQDLFALKAITKRHVLAHQELQHTLTEQAVLKRMAAESRDPFVVKLWWSFHDKENLFLVMVPNLCFSSILESH